VVSRREEFQENIDLWWQWCCLWTFHKPHQEHENSQAQLGNLSLIREHRHGRFLIKLWVDSL